MTQIPPMVRQQEATSAVGRWAMSQVAPGWDALEVHLTARGQRWDVGLVDRRAGGEGGRWVVPVEPGSQLEADATALREASYHHPVGTWVSAVVTLTAAGWPDPRVSLEARFVHDDEPTYLLADQPRVSAYDLLEDWVRFPRTRAATPAWVLERAARAGLELPFVPEPTEAAAAPSSPAAAPVPSSPDAAAVLSSPVTGPVPSSPDTASPAAAAVLSPPVPGPLPSPPDTASHAASSEAGRRSSPPALTVRPAELALLIDRDGIPLSGGRRPQQRRGTVDGRATWNDILTSVGAPLTFVDGSGTWVAVRPVPGGDDVVVGVVAQTSLLPDGSPEVAVHVTTEAQPWQLADAEGTLTLHYVSAAGPLDEVLAAAREGLLRPPAARRGDPPDNAPLRAALVEHAVRGDGSSLRDVLRQALGGLLVLDAGGSRLDASPPQVVVSYVTGPDGARGLPAFSRNAEVQAFRGESPEGVVTIVQPAAATLQGAAEDASVTFLVLDPAGARAVLPADLVRKALTDGHNQAVKDLLASGAREAAATEEVAGTTAAPGWDYDAPGMQDLFDALRTDDAFLFIAEREVEGRAQPVWLEEPEGRVLLAFTSPVEAAAYDDRAPLGPGAGYRRLPVGWILEFLLQSRGHGLRINPGGPTADLGIAQVRHLLANPVMD